MSETKYEFVDGVLCAMAGGMPDHAQICASVSLALNSVAGLANPMAVSFESLYPIVCMLALALWLYAGNARFPKRTHTSSSTPPLSSRFYPRRPRAMIEDAKSPLQRITSVRTVVLIASEGAWAEVYERQSEDEWTVHEYSKLDRTVPLSALQAEMPLSDSTTRSSF
jgi:hypothetical protein